MMNSLIVPDWVAPLNVRAYSSTRMGGVSDAPYDALNLGAHVGDDPEVVTKNRIYFSKQVQAPGEPYWLEQVHGTQVIVLQSDTPRTDLKADAAYTQMVAQMCVVMTADCLPVLFCNRQGTEVAAAHAGWRGLCHGILEQTLACFQARPEDILVWLGPAIGPQHFEVGAEVRAQFLRHDPQATAAFVSQGVTYLADIYLLARQRLMIQGVVQISGGEFCTFSDEVRFFSYRREGATGRMASVIWLQ